MTTAILIPAYNGLEYLKANLPSLLQLKAGEIIIVDDASVDGTSEYIKDNYPGIHLITNAKNQGFTKAVNIGFRSTAADVVFLLNQDVLPSSGLVKQSLPYFQKNPRLFALSFNEGKFGWAKAWFEKGFLQYHNQITPSVHSSFWASGGSCAVRKSVWEELHGFDPVYSPGYYEDLDISWRAAKRGFSIIWVPQIKVDHTRETAFKSAYSPVSLQRIKERNYLICQWKNLDSRHLRVHFLALLFRCLIHPGYIIPTLLAFNRIFSIFSYRRSVNKVLPDSQIFNG